MPETTLVAHELRAGYTAHTPIVRDFTFAFPAGTVTTIVGPNGAGKSTLLKTIGGMTRLHGGSLKLGETEIAHLPPWERVGAGLGFVPQGRCNFPGMTVADNLACAVHALPRALARRRIASLEELLPVLGPKRRQLAGNLSGGEQQVLEMAMVLVREPSVLLLDEPSLGLSPRAQGEIFGLLDTIRAEGVAVVMVEQNARAGLAVSQLALVMDQGRLAIHGPAGEILDDPRVRDVYLGGSVPSTDNGVPSPRPVEQGA